MEPQTNNQGEQGKSLHIPGWPEPLVTEGKETKAVTAKKQEKNLIGVILIFLITLLIIGVVGFGVCMLILNTF